MNYIKKLDIKNKLIQYKIILSGIKISLVGAISKIITFLTFPLLSKVFSVEEIGQIDFILSFVLTITTIALMGQDSSIIRFYNEDHNELRRSALLTSILSTILTMSVLIWLICYLILSIIEIPILSEILKNEICLIFLMIGIALSSLVDASLRSQGDVRTYIFYTVIFNTINCLPILWVFYVNNNSTSEFIMIYSLCITVTGLLSLLLIKKNLVYSEIKLCSSRLIQYGWPLMAVSAIALLQPLTERTIISVLANDQDLGMYSVTLKLVVLIQLPFTLLANALFIEIIKLSNTESGKLIINRLINLYIYMTSGVILIFIVLIDYIIDILYDSRYANASIYAAILALGVYVYNVGGILAYGLFLAEKTAYKLISSFIALLISIGFGYILVPLIGVIAIPLTFLLSKTVSSIFDMVFSYKFYNYKTSFWGNTNIFIISTLLLSLVTLLKLFNSNQYSG